MKRTFQALFAATLAIAAIVAPAGAAETTRTQVQVHYADLNLETRAGAQILLRRLDHAARQACGVERGARGFAPRRQSECAARALSKAVTTVGSPMLAQAYAERETTTTVFASR